MYFISFFYTTLITVVRFLVRFRKVQFFLFVSYLSFYKIYSAGNHAETEQESKSNFLTFLF